MTEDQAARTSWHEYELRRKGKDEEIHEHWSLIRWLAWQEMLLSPNIKPAHKPKTPLTFCRFPWEQPDQDELVEKAREYKVTPEEEVALNKILQDWEAKHAPKKVEDNG